MCWLRPLLPSSWIALLRVPVTARLGRPAAQRARRAHRAAGPVGTIRRARRRRRPGRPGHGAVLPPGSTSSPATWAGSAPATTSPCTSSTSPTSKPAPGRHWARSTHSVLPEVRREPLGRGQGLPGCGGGSCGRARHPEIHRRAGSRGCVHRPHRLFDPGVDPPRPRLPRAWRTDGIEISRVMST